MTDPRSIMGPMADSLEATTGRSVEDWLATAQGLGLARHGEIMAALRRDHGLGYGYAYSLALIATGYGQLGEAELVEDLFAGPKAGLRAIYDRALEVATGMGEDVAVVPEEDDGDLPPDEAVRLLHADVREASGPRGQPAGPPRGRGDRAWSACGRRRAAWPATSSPSRTPRRSTTRSSPGCAAPTTSTDRRRPDGERRAGDGRSDRRVRRRRGPEPPIACAILRRCRDSTRTRPASSRSASPWPSW